MVPPGNANEISTMSAMLDLQVPLADQDLIQHRQRLHQLALAALFQPTENQKLTATQMASAVLQNTNNN
jgi:hypothetical protein